MEVGCLVSCCSENVAPVGLTLTPGHLRHGLEVNSTEFQWCCWPRLFGFHGETGHQGCNQIGYCYSAYPLSLSIFCPLTLSLNLSLPVWVTKLWRIIPFSSFWLSEDLILCLLFRRMVCFLFPVVNDAEKNLSCTFHHELPKTQFNPSYLIVLHWMSKINKVKLDKTHKLKPAGCFNKQMWPSTVNKSFLFAKIVFVAIVTSILSRCCS